MVPAGLRVVQLMKANVSATDSTIGLRSACGASRAHASRGCKNDRPIAIMLIAIVTRDLFILVMQISCLMNKGMRVGGERKGSAPRGSPPSSRLEAVDESLQEDNDV